MQNSSYTGRSARSMQSAFGPYTSNQLAPMRDSRRVQDTALYIVSAIAFVVVVATAIL